MFAEHVDVRPRHGRMGGDDASQAFPRSTGFIVPDPQKFWGKVITGVAVTVQGLRLPNRRQQAIVAERSVLNTAGIDEERLSVMPSLIGRLLMWLRSTLRGDPKRCGFLDLWRTCGGERARKLNVAFSRARGNEERDRPDPLLIVVYEV